MDYRLKTAAVALWLGGAGAVIAKIFYGQQWIQMAGGGCFAGGATVSIAVIARGLSRHTRRAVYRAQCWDDFATSDMQAVPDAIDLAAKRTMASRSGPPAQTVVTHVQHQGGSSSLGA